ncbi:MULTISPECIES: sensor histidine kinase [Pseudanabaena]|uniref:histidine kinase n=2 Tax=Pseudanabaena TaxID=1152 RepID=L8N4W8_9CYAN|nr:MULTISPECIES: HAMP domain-containing sensor histidine kinase [Pseudanabaena]ELS33258.1 integral membrane sensor signal transduction histidine kinase [Pseudanabaena biceps PCC 7429]MDG3494516.1 HAMP domain-containing sensor histidine kinase [Pseudanabaena catenata USMAC16]
MTTVVPNPVFQSMRRRLAFWYASVTAVLLIVFATGFYLYVQSTLIDRIDDTIDHVAEVIERSLIRSNLIDLESDFSRNFSANAQAIDADHIDIDWFSAKGEILWTTNINTESLQMRERGILRPVYRTVHLSAAEPLRQMTEPIVINGKLLGYLRISHPWFEVTKPIKQLFLDLAIGTTLMIFVVLLCGWWLAGIALEPVRESYQRLKQFTADASHELRNPIAVIQTNVQVALADPDPAFQRSQLEAIERITRRLGRLIDDLLFLARHDGGMTNQRREACNLSQILYEVGKEQEAIAQQKGICLELPSPDAKLIISGDRDRLGRLFTNLVSNAIAYTPKGGKVQIAALSNSQDRVQVQVKDTGMGIPETELSQIFERFYRYQPQKSSKSSSKSANSFTSGSGLGLAIAKAIAESHQGQITVESKVGQGTTFTVNL